MTQRKPTRVLPIQEPPVLEQRLYWADNLCSPPNLLEKLSVDPTRDVRRKVALNPSTPLEVLKGMVRDSDSVIRLYVRVRLDSKSWRKVLRALR